MFRLFSALSILLILPVLATDTIKVGSANWQDFTSPDGSGIYFELLRKVFPDKDLEFIVTPFAKSKQNFERDTVDIIVGIYREDLANKILPNWSIGKESPLIAFYNKRHTSPTGIDDIGNMHASWIRGYDFEKFIYLAKPPYLVADIDAGFKLLNKNRIQVFVDYPYNYSKEKYPNLGYIEIMPSRKIYVAFQNNIRGKNLAEQFDNKMAELYASGTLKELFGGHYLSADFESNITQKTAVTVITDEHNLLGIKEEYRLDLHSSLYQVANLLSEQLENFNFKYTALQASNAPLENSEGSYCLLNAVKTPKRESNYLISTPLTMYQGLRLFSQTKLEDPFSIELPQLITANPHLKLGIPENRSFGKAIDSMINKIPITQLTKGSVSELLTIKQFHKKRFELLIESPVVFFPYWNKYHPDTPIHSYRINSAPDYSFGHLICNKSELSSQLINETNNALIKLYQSGLFYKAQRALVVGEDKAMFDKAYRTYFK